jgi:hypothetical protein
VIAGYTGASGVVRFSSDPSRYLYFDGTNFSLNGGTTFSVSAALVVQGVPVYGNIPTYSPANGYVTVAADGQKLLWLTGTITINSPAHVVGTAITFFAWGGDLNINFANGAGMHWYGPSGATSGNRVLKQYGVATAHQFASGYWLISGSGLT